MTGLLLPLRPAGDARVRLVVFPHAGGGPSALSAWAELLPPTVAPVALNLPGRQARLHEPSRTDLTGLVDDVARELADPLPYALFGYCSGALLAHLVTRRVHDLPGAVPPERWLVGSFGAPDVADVPRRLAGLPSEAFWDRLLGFGGLPPEVAELEELRPVLEPALRADFGLLAAHRHVPGPPVPTPITVLHGERDTSLSRGALLGWRRQSTARPDLVALPASHWLLDDAPEQLAAAITATLDGGPA